MNGEGANKVTGDHLKRDAYLYVRQAAIGPAYQNLENLERQYTLRQRAIALGWPNDRIRIIDGDCGVSAARNAGREGFERLVAEVGEGRAGIVMALDVSRFARTYSDWCRLAELCTLTNTLILEETGVYDPSTSDDRMVLGLKTIMFVEGACPIRRRRRGGIRRGAPHREREAAAARWVHCTAPSRRDNGPRGGAPHIHRQVRRESDVR
ncbi:MAG: recombinase family protein [Armatimonadetes bacterium]|nr:recombinase family protein [Armatimonadota bacterium]